MEPLKMVGDSNMKEMKERNYTSRIVLLIQKNIGAIFSMFG